MSTYVKDLYLLQKCHQSIFSLPLTHAFITSIQSFTFIHHAAYTTQKSNAMREIKFSEKIIIIPRDFLHRLSFWCHSISKIMKN